jgi:hypothetical protein
VNTTAHAMDDWCVLPSMMQTSAVLHSFRVRARRTTLSHAGRPVHMDWHVTGRVTAVCVRAPHTGLAAQLKLALLDHGDCHVAVNVVVHIQLQAGGRPYIIKQSVQSVGGMCGPPTSYCMVSVMSASIPTAEYVPGRTMSTATPTPPVRCAAIDHNHDIMLATIRAATSCTCLGECAPGGTWLIHLDLSRCVQGHSSA